MTSRYFVRAVDVPSYHRANHRSTVNRRPVDPKRTAAGKIEIMAANRRPYLTRDGYVCALIYTDRHWQAFFEAAGRRDESFADRRVSDHATRARYYDEIYGIIADTLRTRTTAEWLALFERRDIPCARMNDLDALIDDPHLKAAEFWQTHTHPTEGTVRYTGIPSRWNGTALTVTRHAPQLSEHSISILQEASIPAETIGALIGSGATTVNASIAPKTDAAAAQTHCPETPITVASQQTTKHRGERG